MRRLKAGRKAQRRAELATAKEQRRKRNMWIAILLGIIILVLMIVANVVMEINRPRTPAKTPSNEVRSKWPRRD